MMYPKGKWEVEKRTINEIVTPRIFIWGEKGNVIAETFGKEAKANANFIVKAVNSHAKLLEACKQIIRGADFSYKGMHMIKKDSLLYLGIKNLIAQAEKGEGLNGRG